MADANTTMTPAAAAPAQQGVAIDQKDVHEWVGRFNAALADTKTITANATADARPWSEGFFACFNPIDTCAITCCLPCVTFGKTHHRIRKDSNLHGYNFVNASRIDIRNKYNLQGSFVTDLLTSCCCGCCSIIQQDKEAAVREKEIHEKEQGYGKVQGMEYGSA
ncbi:hypothetical protein DV737_g805, partial [Chaetothyriales sp. CBS 132003]